MSYGILTGKQIEREVDAGSIAITPFDRRRVNPASVDLTLGAKIAVYESVVIPDFDGEIPGERMYARTGSKAYLDAKKKNGVVEYEMDGRGILIKPGLSYLMHTAERVFTERFVPVLDGKSSIGRLFVFVHVTAGYGDPGFNGQYTLEVTSVHPVVLYPGMRICQMRFHTLVGEVDSYQRRGSYRGRLAEGPIPSQSYKMFEAQPERSDFSPLPEGTVRTNGGVRCDMAVGPCACGAWHKAEDAELPST